MAMSPSGTFSQGMSPRGGGGGAGDDKTLVGFSCPRQRVLRLSMVSSSHNSTASSDFLRQIAAFEVAANAMARRTISSASGNILHASDSIRMSTAGPD